MDEKEFYELTKEVDGLYHVEITSPNYISDHMTVRILDGPLKEMHVEVPYYGLKE